MDTQTIRVVKAMQGVSTGDLAKRAGVRRETVWRWETGQPNVSPQTAERLLHALMDPIRTPAAPAK